MIGVPVLAGSAAYAMAEAMGWREGLEKPARDAQGFYAVIAISVLAAIALQYTPISPMRALVWSAVVNGVVAVPILVVVVRIAAMSSVMGPFTTPRGLRILGWLAIGAMALSALGLADLIF